MLTCVLFIGAASGIVICWLGYCWKLEHLVLVLMSCRGLKSFSNDGK